MALTSGTKLGPYEIQSPLGAGGMGEVYRARDTRLDRTVAVKILPTHLSSPEAKQRFEREARAISSLNHPNICTLHDVGHQEGIDFLVMEYLEGETLADRLAKGALPPEQVLKYGIEICEGLERAHKSGVVHRDLKPGNVMLTKTGAKLMDFGLAKAAMPEKSPSSGLTATLMSPGGSHPLTAQGTVVGTFQYMSPEQVEGKEADARSDIFALGAVLYEMATGKRAFTGKSQASIVAAILASDPQPISAVQPMSPPALDRVVRTCLAKDPDERWQTAHDVKLQLKWIAEGGSQAGVAAPVVARRKHREWLAWGLTAILLLLAVASGTAYWRLASAPQRVIRSAILLPQKAGFSLMGRNGVPALSPDGTKVAFVAVKEGQRSIWLRSLGSAEATALSGTEEGYAPFWSPDSRYLAFFAGGKLQKIAVEGGPPEVICDADDARGGSWGSKNVLLFTPTRYSPIFSVPASGGTPVQVTDLGHALSHRWPHFLPDGEHFLFVATPTGSATNESSLRLGSLKSKDSRMVVASAYNAEFAQGQLLFIRDGKLAAQPFDAERGELRGEPAAITSDIQVDALFSHALFSVSANGVLVYEPGVVSNQAQLIWYDHKGKQLSTLGEPGIYIEASIAPDESRVAVAEFHQSIDLWIYELGRGIHTRFTTTGNNRYPLWSTDGSTIAFASNRQTSQLSLFRQPANGESPAEPVYLSKTSDLIPTDWSRDGRFMTFTQSSGTTKQDIWVQPLSGEQKPFPFMQTSFNEKAARFSPDGHWIAYDSDESGRYEIYLAPFPAGGRKWQVSNAGGSQALWSKNGMELYYLAPDNTIMSATIASASGAVKIGVPNALFRAHPRNFDYGIYDVTRDGRFLISSAPDESNAPLTLISNWPTLVKK
jgi:eukaryotic-like serine/threonine-protein kinase